MREKKTYKVITFRTTTEAMAMEKYCCIHKINGRLIPVPREISAGCGLAWRSCIEDFPALADNLSDIRFEQIVELEL